MQANKKDSWHGKYLLNNTSRNREQGLRDNYKRYCRGSLLEILKGVLKLLKERFFVASMRVEKQFPMLYVL
eukprot:1781015-Amphidinium_carterae.1